MFSDLLCQILSPKNCQDKVLDNPIQVLEYKGYSLQEHNNSPKSLGPWQSTTQLTSPPPAAASPAKTVQLWKQLQDSRIGLWSAYLKNTKNVSKT